MKNANKFFKKMNFKKNNFLSHTYMNITKIYKYHSFALYQFNKVFINFLLL